MYLLSKKFRFESAHRLALGYVGKCANIHGHSWNGMLTIECEELDNQGFGMDYADIKKITKPYEDNLDHKILLHAQDKGIIDLCKDNGWKFVSFNENPTSEVIAKDMFNYASQYLHDNDLSKKGYRVKCVTIEETCTSKCEYYG